METLLMEKELNEPMIKHVKKSQRITRDGIFLALMDNSEVYTSESNQFFENAPDMLCVLDFEGRFKRVSNSFQTVLGYEQKELLNKPFLDFVIVEYKSETNHFPTAMKADSHFHYENCYKCKDGSSKWIAWRSCVDMKTRKMYAVGREITDQKNAELKEKAYSQQLKQLIEQKEKSLRYARSIQEAMIPVNELYKSFPDSFIYYSPKDIVSGDFAWVSEVDNLVFVAAADCTGHGVPGAMITMVCSMALNRVVKELGITRPGEILDCVSRIVVENFGNSKKDIKDGMDISLCCINRDTNEVYWSGANNPLWYIRNGEMVILKGDKQPIGLTDEPQPFITHYLKLNKGTCLYMFSDGFADQFGGDAGKKFRPRKLMEKLMEMQHLPMKDQKNILYKTFENWKGLEEQVDDVLVMGIRL